VSVEENKAAVRLFYQQMDKGNLDIVDKLGSINYVGHVPGFEDVTGRKGLKDLLIVFHSAFPDLLHIIEDLIAEGDKVVWPIHASRHTEGRAFGSKSDIPSSDIYGNGILSL
jgi:predicted ester cyclase